MGSCLAFFSSMGWQRWNMKGNENPPILICYTGLEGYRAASEFLSKARYFKVEGIGQVNANISWQVGSTYRSWGPQVSSDQKLLQSGGNWQVNANIAWKLGSTYRSCQGLSCATAVWASTPRLFRSTARSNWHCDSNGCRGSSMRTLIVGSLRWEQLRALRSGYSRSCSHLTELT